MATPAVRRQPRVFSLGLRAWPTKARGAAAAGAVDIGITGVTDVPHIGLERQLDERPDVLGVVLDRERVTTRLKELTCAEYSWACVRVDGLSKRLDEPSRRKPMFRWIPIGAFAGPFHDAIAAK